MKNIKHIASVTLLVFALSSSALAGDMPGGRTALSADMQTGKRDTSGAIAHTCIAVPGDMAGGLVELIMTAFSIIG